MINTLKRQFGLLCLLLATTLPQPAVPASLNSAADLPAADYLDPRERQWVSSNPSILLGSTETAEPLLSVNDKLEFRGLLVDIIDEINTRSGLNIKIRAGKLADLEQEMAAGTLKGLIHISPMRAMNHGLLLTDAINHTFPVMFAGKQGVGRIDDISVLNGKTIIALSDRYYIDSRLRYLLPDSKIVHVDSLTQAIQMLINGKADYYFGLSIDNHTLLKHGIVSVEPVYFDLEHSLYFGIGITSDNPQLASIIDKTIKQIGEAKLVDITARWSRLAIGNNYALNEQEKSWLAKQKEVRVGYFENNPPFQFIYQGESRSGLISDYLDLLQNYVGIPFRYTGVESQSEGLAALTDHDIDLLAVNLNSLPKTPGILATEPFLSFEMVIVQAEGSDFFADIRALSGKSVVVIRNSAAEQFVRRELLDVKTLTVEDFEQANEWLLQGRADALLTDNASFNYYRKLLALDDLSVSALTGFRTEIGFVMRAEWAPLLYMLDRRLKQLTNVEKQLIQDKWLNVRVEKEFNWTLVLSIVLSMLAAFVMIVSWFAIMNRRLSREILERTQAQQEAVAANQAKSTFLANMSHEIRTPLNGIVGMIHLVRQTGLNEVQKEYINTITSSSQSLLGIINDILDFSKIEADKLEVEKIEVDLEAVIADISASLSLKAREKGIDLLFDVAEDVPNHFLGDPLRLKQVLLNLINNAIKFTEAGEVRVAVALASHDKDNCVLQFSVKDTGIGIAPEKLKLLFEPFRQADDSTTRQYGGTGLGLAISKRLVELMGGRISVVSQQGEGSCFSFSLAVQVFHFSDALAHDPGSVTLRGAVLLVDAGAQSSRVLKAQLESFGLDVEISATLADVERAVADIPSSRLLVINATQAFSEAELAILQGLGDVKLVILVAREHEAQLHRDCLGMDYILVDKPISNSGLFNAVLLSLHPEGTDAYQSGAAEEAANGAQGGQSGKANLLLAEDNIINQQVARGMLKQLGLDVDIVENGKQALEQLEQKHYDLVLMDIQMPVMDGYEATARIRQDPRFKDLPVLAMTANAMVGDRERCLAAGMNDHIAKPISPQLLKKVLRRWLPARFTLQDFAHRGAGRQGALDKLAGHGDAAISLPVLDRQAGLKRMLNDPDLYQQLLDNFAARYSGAKNELGQMLDDGRYREAVDFLHQLSNSAANLSALAVRGAAIQLESQLREGKACGRNSREFSLLIAALQQLNAQISKTDNAAMK